MGIEGRGNTDDEDVDIGGMGEIGSCCKSPLFDAVADIVNGFAEVAHNYARDHALNMWFVVATDRHERVAEVLAEIESGTGLRVYDMPKIEEFFIGLRFAA